MNKKIKITGFIILGLVLFSLLFRLIVSIEIPIDTTCEKDSQCSMDSLSSCDTCGGSVMAYNSERVSFKLAKIQKWFNSFLPCKYTDSCSLVPLNNYAVCEENVCVKKTEVNCLVRCVHFPGETKWDPENSCNCSEIEDIDQIMHNVYGDNIPKF